MTNHDYTSLKQKFCDEDHLGEKVLITLTNGGSIIVDAETLNFTQGGSVLQLQDREKANVAVIAAGQWISAVRMLSTPVCVVPEPASDVPATAA